MPRQPLRLLHDPGHRFVLDGALSGDGSVESQMHGLEVNKYGDRVGVRLDDGEIVPDRNSMLSWCPPAVEKFASRPHMSAETVG
jgi:hypothetical protein